jgi:hypothetical protein
MQCGGNTARNASKTCSRDAMAEALKTGSVMAFIYIA